MADHAAHDQAMTIPPAWPWVVLLLAWSAAYLIALRRAPAGKRWSPWRTVSWHAGLAVAAAALVGPLAHASHTDFRAHMLGHLLLGMLAPILLVLAAPITLLLRALPVHRARGAARLLSATPSRLLAHPVTASVLHVGGLIALYRTDLFALMREHAAVSLLVQAHVLAAGYLFTAAMIGLDPIAHRPSRRFRVAVLVAALAAHATLAKSLYALPPPGVPAEQAEAGGLLMYYGGDVVDLLLIVVFCWQWYRETAPRRPIGAAAPMAIGPAGGGSA